MMNDYYYDALEKSLLHKGCDKKCNGYDGCQYRRFDGICLAKDNRDAIIGCPHYPYRDRAQSESWYVRNNINI